MYSKLQKTATGIIGRWGIAASISSRVGFVVKDNLSYEYQKANGTLFRVGDVSLICSASLSPENGNDIAVGNEIYRVINVMPVNPATINVIVEVHARRMA